MRRRPMARVATGVAVGTVALTSVFAGTAWAPKIKTVPEWVITKEECQAGWERIGDRSFDSFAECIRAANDDRRTFLR